MSSGSGKLRAHGGRVGDGRRDDPADGRNRLLVDAEPLGKTMTRRQSFSVSGKPAPRAGKRSDRAPCDGSREKNSGERGRFLQ